VADGTTHEIASAFDRQRPIDPSYEIYLGLYQALTGSEERQKLFRAFSLGFFDLIIIDECHRASAAEDAAWREILDYFSGATRLGLYSLKQGIQDGFLGPLRRDARRRPVRSDHRRTLRHRGR
jgi:type I restriction enzyme R subunit